MEMQGKKAWELEPGDAFSTDEGRTWVRARTVVELPDPGVDIIRVNTTSNQTLDLDTWQHVLIASLPSELAAVALLP